MQLPDANKMRCYHLHLSRYHSFLDHNSAPALRIDLKALILRIRLEICLHRSHDNLELISIWQKKLPTWTQDNWTRWWKIQGSEDLMPLAPRW